MPSNHGYLRRKSLKEEALVRLEARLEVYLVADPPLKDKIKTTETDIANLKRNLQMTKKGRSW